MQFSTTLLALLPLLTSTLALPATSNLTARSTSSTYTIQACIDLNLEGQCTEISGSYNSCTNVPANFNDAISSIASDQNGNCRAYSDAECQEIVFVVPRGEQIMRILGEFNDLISSFWC